MIAKSFSALPLGFTGALVTIESNATQGVPAFNIVGMAAKTINEARDRVRSAVIHSGFNFPAKKITLNLAPADLPKNTTGLDLAIAINILLLSGQILPSEVTSACFLGELSLDGSIHPIKGIINAVEVAKSAGLTEIYLPTANFRAAALVTDVNLHPISDLKSLYLELKNLAPSSNCPVVKKTQTVVKASTPSPLLDHICGQTQAKRALSIAIAGHHNILLSGPPGAGKTLLAKVAKNLLPDLSPSEQLTLTKLYSLGNETTAVITSRPFRSPHHTSSLAALIGGGTNALPGEISLAHKGILFLDELPEYPRHLLESLRQPLEDKSITLSRANLKTTYPADFMLIATMNPCPCGHLGSAKPCTCSPSEILRYQKRLSGPLLDRIDLFVNIDPADTSTLLDPSPLPPAQNPSSPTDNLSTHTVVKNTITDVIKLQYARYRDDATYNSTLSSAAVRRSLVLSPAAKDLLTSASNSLSLSTRSFSKVIRVAQTIADLASATTNATTNAATNAANANANPILPDHIAEALTYRYRPPEPL